MIYERPQSLKTDWKTYKPVKPTFFGTKVIRNQDLQDLLPFIDWKYFLMCGNLGGGILMVDIPKFSTMKELVRNMGLLITKGSSINDVLPF